MSDASDLMALGMAPALANGVVGKIAAGGGGVTPQPAPTVAIDDPVSQDAVQQAFDSIINGLKAAGVFT